jgi:hypothetical protein
MSPLELEYLYQFRAVLVRSISHPAFTQFTETIRYTDEGEKERAVLQWASSSDVWIRVAIDMLDSSGEVQFIFAWNLTDRKGHVIYRLRLNHMVLRTMAREFLYFLFALGADPILEGLALYSIQMHVNEIAARFPELKSTSRPQMYSAKGLPK